MPSYVGCSGIVCLLVVGPRISSLNAQFALILKVFSLRADDFYEFEILLLVPRVEKQLGNFRCLQLLVFVVGGTREKLIDLGLR